MKTVILENYSKLSQYCAEKLCRQLEQTPNSLICIAAGNTSLGIFEELIKMNNAGKIDFSKAHFIAMDEWLNMNVDTQNSCSSFLKRHFISKVNLKPEHVRYVDGTAKDKGKECAEIEQYIDSFGGIDFLLLGCGQNGHLALNEPGTDFDSTVHVTQLDEITKTVGQKYFNETVSLEGGITIGIRQIRQAKKTILAVNSDSKKQIVQAIINSPIGTNIPATALREIKEAELVCDKAAALAINS